MRLLDLTLDSPARNLALDEALLNEAEAGRLTEPVLRFWESPQIFVVLGLSGVLEREVQLEACQTDRIPILRRHSGGGTVLQGPGCLSYALVLPRDYDARLSGIASTNAFVLERVAAAFQPWHRHVRIEGISDLVVGDRKVGGSAQRRKRNWILFHGTLLFRFEPTLLTRYLANPPRQPAYRQRRSHEQFVTNLDLEPNVLKFALAEVFDVGGMLTDWPAQRVSVLEASFMVPSESRL